MQRDKVEQRLGCGKDGRSVPLGGLIVGTGLDAQPCKGMTLDKVLTDRRLARTDAWVRVSVKYLVQRNM